MPHPVIALYYYAIYRSYASPCHIPSISMLYIGHMPHPVVSLSISMLYIGHMSHTVISLCITILYIGLLLLPSSILSHPSVRPCQDIWHTLRPLCLMLADMVNSLHALGQLLLRLTQLIVNALFMFG